MELPNLKTDTDEPEFIIYMFVNSVSGGNAGKQFFDIQVDSIRYLLGHKEVLVRFYDLKDEFSKAKGLRRLKKHVKVFPKDKLIVIICGGDGTVGWVLNEIKEAEINLQDLVFGILPLGTGNDFSRVLNWGPGGEGDLIGFNLLKLKGLVTDWVMAQISNFDIWHVKVTVYDNGHFEKIQDKSSTPMHEQEISRTFTNYSGFGMDGQVGYGFDKIRTQSKAMNIMMYAGVGFMNLFKKPIGVETLVHKMEQKQGNSIKEVFSTEDHRDNQGCKIKGGLKNILALNINSFMGGISDIWETESNAIEGDKQAYLPQTHNDGLLEFVSWRNEVEMVMEKVVNNAYKVAQGSGPFHIEFKQVTDKDHHTYIQIDGQFFKVYHPKDITYSKSNVTPTGQIRVLKGDFQ